MVLLDWCSWLLSLVINAQNVTFVLMLMLACSMGITIERTLCYLRARFQSRAFIRETADAFRERDTHEILFVAYRKRHSHVATVVACGLEYFAAASQGLPRLEALAMASRALDHAAATLHRKLKSGLPTLATIASTAPLVGLLGTVDGIFSSFRGTSMARSTWIAMMTHELADSLSTAAFGLLVAIPAVWSYNYFSAQLEALTIETANSSSNLRTYLTTQSPRRP